MRNPQSGRPPTPEGKKHENLPPLARLAGHGHSDGAVSLNWNSHTLMNTPWSDSVVLITGGTRGIGKAIALRLSRERPRHLVLAYCMNHQAARETVAEIISTGASVSTVVCDVGDERMQREMFQQIEEEHQRLDIFVANAARTAFKSAADLDPRSWRRTMQLNAEAFLLGAQLAAPLMRRNGGGRIVGLSSLGSRYYVPQYAALGAAKAAIESLARYLAVEYAPFGINVNVVCGGFVDTDSMRMIPDYDQVVRTVVERTPAGRIAQPDDLARVVAFLCSADSDWIRGQTLVADGGFSLRG
jgi:enoyl-[acyl-carrier protein] reductase III